MILYRHTKDIQKPITHNPPLLKLYKDTVINLAVFFCLNISCEKVKVIM